MTTALQTRSAIRAVFAAGASLLALVATSGFAAPLASVDRNGAIVSVEPYAPNIVRVTIAVDRALADAPPGDGPNATPDPTGWTHASTAGSDVFTSPAISLTVKAEPWPKAPTQMQRYFAPSLPHVGLVVRGADGHTIAEMTGWEMAPAEVNGEKTFHVGARFAVQPGEHYYGLGQNQEGVLDLKGRTIDCQHYYDAPAGESVCVPFMVTNKGYGIVWDNASATTVSPGLNDSTHWQSKVG